MAASVIMHQSSHFFSSLTTSLTRLDRVISAEDEIRDEKRNTLSFLTASLNPPCEYALNAESNNQQSMIAQP